MAQFRGPVDRTCLGNRESYETAGIVGSMPCALAPGARWTTLDFLDAEVGKSHERIFASMAFWKG